MKKLVLVMIIILSMNMFVYANGSTNKGTEFNMPTPEWYVLAFTGNATEVEKMFENEKIFVIHIVSGIENKNKAVSKARAAATKLVKEKLVSHIYDEIRATTPANVTSIDKNRNVQKYIVTKVNELYEDGWVVIKDSWWVKMDKDSYNKNMIFQYFVVYSINPELVQSVVNQARTMLEE